MSDSWDLSMCSGITTITDTVTSLLCMKLYEVIASSYGVYLNYLIYSGFSLAGLIIMYFVVPETKGRSFAQIQAELNESLNESKTFIPKEFKRKSTNHFTQLWINLIVLYCLFGLFLLFQFHECWKKKVMTHGCGVIYFEDLDFELLIVFWITKIHLKAIQIRQLRHIGS